MPWLITLASQVCGEGALSVSVAGESITVNGDTLDLSGLVEGEPLDFYELGYPWLADNIRRIDGVIHISLLFPLRYGAPEEARFPAPISVTADGPVTLPPNGDA